MLERFRRARPIPPPPPPDPPLDEIALRRPDFVEGPQYARVELGNGQSWSIPRPVIELRVVEKPDGTLAYGDVPMYGDGRTRCFGQEYLDTLDRISAAKNDRDYLDAMVGVAAILLRQNYTLTTGHLARLLPWVVAADQPNETMWKAIRGVVAGEGPKPDLDIDELDSSSPEDLPDPSF